MTQCERIMEYIKTHGSITQAEAFNYLGVGRLAARVSDLRNRGTKITTETIKVKNRYGVKTEVARYRLG